MQSAKQAQIQEQAKMDIFERQNVTVASDHTTGAISLEAHGRAEALKGQQNIEASGFSIQANAKRAKESKVRSYFVDFVSVDVSFSCSIG